MDERALDPRAARLRGRVLFLAVLLAVAFLGLIARLGHLQVLRHEELYRLAEAQHAKTIALRPRRGTITDRNGVALAVSAAAETLYALPARVDNPARLAARLAPVIGESPAEIRRRLQTGRRLVFVKRRLSPDVARAVRELGEPALGFVEESLRLYPHRELAAHAVGFEGHEGKGLAGVEQAWDRVLAGEEGRALVERDALGREVTGAPVVLRPARPGHDVVLTLDATLQHVAEREIDAAWRRTRARAAMAVAMDPRTGEVLAMAIRPAFNPNSFSTASDEERRNRAVTDPFEPGSTFKVILAAAALEERVVRPDDRFHGDNGLIRVANVSIRDWKPHGWLSFAEVLQQSSNVGSIKVGLALGKERYYKYIQGFGFGQPTGLGLAGESRGQLRSPERWSGLSLATMSIGQEISVTALQMVTAISAVANGGRLLQPQLVREVRDAAGRPVERFAPRLLRQVIAPETSRTLVALLSQVVRDGTGRNAAIPGYAVAGKTGTAQKMDPATQRYSRAPGVLSFVGFVPADDPRLAMIVLLDEPKTERWGSEAAAPIFAAIGREALRHLHVPPGDSPPVQIVRADPAPTGSGPAPLEIAPIAAASEPAGAAAVMPAVGGLSLRQALATLAPYELPIEVQGRGVVVAQSPAPGEPLEPGIRGRLTLAPPAARR